MGRPKLHLTEMQTIAKRMGGTCLSNRYIDTNHSLRWRCSRGHVWVAAPKHIKYEGCWCRRCFFDKRRLSLTEMQDLAKKRKGKCLSKIYVNSRTPLKWECAKGHIWKAASGYIKSGGWCQSCFDDKNCWTLAELCDIAKKRGGTCLSKKIKSVRSRLLWKCVNGHTWVAKCHDVIHGTWCPYCKVWWMEEQTRKIFEDIFHAKFIRLRPDWLRNGDNNRLELDGYCEKLKVAFEYNGVQHYQHVPRFNSQSLSKLKNHDVIKRRLCKRQGIRLFQIPHHIKKDRLQVYILNRIRIAGLGNPVST